MVKESISSVEDIRIWQQQLVQGVLRALVLVGPAVGAAGAYDAYSGGQPWLIPFYAGAYAILVLITFWRRIPYTLRAGTLLGLAYGLGVLDFFEDGRGGSGRLFMLAVAAVAVLFFGKREGMLALLLSILTTVVFGWAHISGHMVVLPEHEVNSANPAGWLSNTFALILLGTLVVVSQNYLVIRLAATLARSRRLSHELEAHRARLEEQVIELRRAEQTLRGARDELEERVEERTAELARTNEALRVEVGERTRAEAVLARQTQELARSNAELEQFAYLASHDLQEPLRKVRSFGDHLQARYGEALDERGRDYLARMQNAAARMETLIRDLLIYSRVTTKAQPFAPVDLAQIAREVVSDLEVRIAQVGGRVEVGDLPVIEADPTQIRQLLQNLIGNALKFHRPDKAPTVKVKAKFLNGRRDGLAGDADAIARYQITVEDNGIGFDQKHLDRIFQVFQRLHGRSEYEGTGIGLATCRKIAERHGGSITARSAPGQGARFIVTLPLKQTGGENES